jgi:hypothetical protein
MILVENENDLPTWVVVVGMLTALLAAGATVVAIHNSGCCAHSILDPQPATPGHEDIPPYYLLWVLAYWIVYTLLILVAAAFLHTQHKETFE